jgi:hypothetical protein
MAAGRADRGAVAGRAGGAQGRRHEEVSRRRDARWRQGERTGVRWRIERAGRGGGRPTSVAGQEVCGAAAWFQAAGEKNVHKVNPCGIKGVGAKIYGADPPDTCPPPPGVDAKIHGADPRHLTIHVTQVPGRRH